MIINDILIYQFSVDIVRYWEGPESGCQIRQSLPCTFGNLTERLGSTLEGWTLVFEVFMWIEEYL